MASDGTALATIMTENAIKVPIARPYGVYQNSIDQVRNRASRLGPGECRIGDRPGRSASKSATSCWF